MLAFRVIYEDEFLVAVDKPPGFHTHPPEDQRIRISPNWNGLRILEKQLQCRLHPAHRLDRAASGVLLLAKSSAASSKLQAQFAARTVEKRYACVARGRIAKATTLDAPLKLQSGQSGASVTRIEPVTSFALPTSADETREFTFLFASPETGRFHQIRRHLAQSGHPLLHDSMHGDRKLSRAVKEQTGLHRLYLRCMEMRLAHPDSGKELRLRARWSREWHYLFERAGVCGWLGAN